MYPTRRRLIEDGYTYEEAEDILDTYAEEQADARRDEDAADYFVTDDERSYGPRA
jgi:hypothetical protein